MRGLAVVLVLSGSACIAEPKLDHCGDQICPLGLTCIDDAIQWCADTDELSACASLVEGAHCTSSAGGGVCIGGGCYPYHCGDGVVEPGEVCDDHNNVSGDGCREDCLSDETCGNGVVDIGEHCDCGSSAATQPAACHTPNSDDPQAQCNTACSNYCGDGAVTGLESCDGATVPVTCAQLGYYAGTPSCSSFCAVDPSTCSGTCGDHIVQAAHEDCDGSAPADTCNDFGRDFGVLGCTSFCAPAITRDCRRYGFRELLPPLATIVAAAGNAHGAVGVDATNVRVLWDGTITSHSNPGWTAAVANATTFVAAGPTSFGVFDGTHWTDVATGITGALALADDGVLYELHADCTFEQIDLATGTATSLTTAPGTQCDSPVAYGDTLYAAGHGDGLFVWDGVMWTIAPIDELVDHVDLGRTGTLLLVSAGVAQDYDPAAQQLTDRPNPSLAQERAVDADNNELDVRIDEGGAVRIPYYVVGAVSGRGDIIGQPIASKFVRSHDGSLLGLTDGLNRFDPTSLPSGPVGAVADMRILDDGTLAYCGDSVGWFSGFGGGTHAIGCNSFIGDPRGEHYVGNVTGIWHYFPGTGYTQESGYLGIELAGDLSDQLAFVGVIVHRVAGSWVDVPLPSGCSETALGGLDGSHIFVAATCTGTGGTILHWDGTQLVAVGPTNGATYSVRQAPDGTMYFGGGHSYRYDGTTLTEIGTGRMIAPVSASDVYLGTADVWVHRIGSITSPVRAVGTKLAATRDVIYSYDPLTTVISVIPRMRSRFASDGL